MLRYWLFSCQICALNTGCIVREVGFTSKTHIIQSEIRSQEHVEILASFPSNLCFYSKISWIHSKDLYYTVRSKITRLYWDIVIMLVNIPSYSNLYFGHFSCSQDIVHSIQSYDLNTVCIVRKLDPLQRPILYSQK